jgi:guanine deaminase
MRLIKKMDDLINRRKFLTTAGVAIAGVSMVGSTAKSASAKTKSFCDEYDTSVTKFTAIEVDEPYKETPPPLEKGDPLQHVQEWDGYNPDCTLKNQDTRENFPPQTSNIKISGVYDGIEVLTNKWMDMAAEEALLSVKNGGGPFGAVILQIDDDSNRVIRCWRNHNHVPEWNDPTAHAEVTTIRAVCDQLGTFDMGNIEKGKSKLSQNSKTSHCVIYSSAEPCPMCYAAIYWARIPELFFAATRYDAAAQGVNFSDEELYADLARSYNDRKHTKVHQCTSPKSLDAFNHWKRSSVTQY